MEGNLGLAADNNMNILDRFRLDNQVALVTGGGRGIGAATAIALAEAGADIAIGARSMDQLQAVSRQIEALGRRALALPLDVMDETQCQHFVEQAYQHFGRVDILVNNAGGGTGPKAFLKTTAKEFQRDFQFNTGSAFTMTQLVSPLMIKSAGGGSVINISSVAGLRPHACFSAYGTAKAAMSFLSQQLAQELAPHIRVNAIAVGSTRTEALDSVLSPEIEQQMLALTPLKRLAEVDDIAAAALFLASPASAYLTGDVMLMNGGLQMLNMAMPRAFD